MQGYVTCASSVIVHETAWVLESWAWRPASRDTNLLSHEKRENCCSASQSLKTRTTRNPLNASPRVSCAQLDCVDAVQHHYVNPLPAH